MELNDNFTFYFILIINFISTFIYLFCIFYISKNLPKKKILIFATNFNILLLHIIYNYIDIFNTNSNIINIFLFIIKSIIYFMTINNFNNFITAKKIFQTNISFDLSPLFLIIQILYPIIHFPYFIFGNLPPLIYLQIFFSFFFYLVIYIFLNEGVKNILDYLYTKGTKKYLKILIPNMKKFHLIKIYINLKNIFFITLFEIVLICTLKLMKDIVQTNVFLYKFINYIIIILNEILFILLFLGLTYNLYLLNKKYKNKEKKINNNEEYNYINEKDFENEEEEEENEFDDDVIEEEEEEENEENNENETSSETKIEEMKENKKNTIEKTIKKDNKIELDS